MDKLELVDRWGRPLLRMTCLFVLANVGLAIAYSFWMWAIFHQTPAPLPGETMLLAALPQIPQIVDLITRSAERRSQIHAGRVPGQETPRPWVDQQALA